MRDHIVALHRASLETKNYKQTAQRSDSKNLRFWQQPLGWQPETVEGNISATTDKSGCVLGNPWRKQSFLPFAQSTLASVLSLSSNSSTSATFRPPALAGGSSTFNTCNRGTK